MSEEIKPVVNEVPADVEKKEQEVKETPVVEEVKEVVEDVKEAVEEVKEAVVNFGEKTLAELSAALHSQAISSVELTEHYLARIQQLVDEGIYPNKLF